MRTQPNKTVALLVLSLITIVPLFAQNLSASLTKKIDSLFTEWNTPTSPGFAIGIVRNDSLIYAKGYGMANLEHGIPITPQTIFNMGSVSKQFTGYCIALLARQGKIKLDEDIHTYLPWMPDYGKKITVRNLLHHTSGLRDYYVLAGISGLGMNGVLTQKQALRMIKKQKALNFNPGDKHYYSNTNYILLTEIVKVVSGKTFRAFSDSALFRPLGMLNSHFQDEYTTLIKNRAAPYTKLDSNRYGVSNANVSTVGDSQLFTNITDMAKWAIHLYNFKASDEAVVKQFVQVGKLNSGKEITYAFGIGVFSYKGWKRYNHAGGLGGYTTNFTVFPELKMGIILYSNLEQASPYTITNQIADIFLKNIPANVISPPISAIDSTLTIIKDTLGVKNLTGNYISEDGETYNFLVRNKKLYVDMYGRLLLLYQLKKDTFSLVDIPEVRFMFSSIDKNNTQVRELWPDGDRIHKKYTVNTTLTDQQLQAYTGKYYSPELDCIYRITLQDHQLMLISTQYDDAKIQLIGKNDMLLTGFAWMWHLSVLRNNKNQITGFEVNRGDVMHLRFNKME